MGFPVHERYLAYWKKPSRTPPKMWKGLAADVTEREVTELLQTDMLLLICNCLMGGYRKEGNTQQQAQVASRNN